MDVIYLTHRAFLDHDTGAWHPERPLRLEAVARGVTASGLQVRRHESPAVEPAVLGMTHPAEYVASIQRFCAAGGGALDPDTVASGASFEAALRAAGSGPAAVALLRASPVESVAFCAVRPPGHHAMANRAMGFCLFNNAVVTARRLRAEGERVLIVDWDVHHGNGTQQLVADDPDIVYVSLHQSPFYPGGGGVDETGVGAGAGTVVNIPLPAGTGGDVYRSAFQRVVLPVAEQFQPSWVLVSAGFDAHEDDPLAEMCLLSSDYAAMAHALRQTVAPNRTIAFLEGGYHLTALTDSVAAMLTGFGGEAAKPETRRSPTGSWEALELAVSVASRRWIL